MVWLLFAPVYPIDLLFLSSKIQLGVTEDLTAGNTKCTLFFFLHFNPPVSSSQMKAIGITFKHKLLTTWHT